MAKMRFSYADDSGTQQGSKFSLLLGYIGSPRQWKSFERAWESALEALPLPSDDHRREFHSKDFFDTRRWKSHENPYFGWTMAQAQAFLDQLLDIIHRHHVEPIGGATNVEHFFEFSEADRKLLTGAPLQTHTRWRKGQLQVTDRLKSHRSSPNRPYFVTFPGFLLEAMWASRKAGNANVHLVFDRQGDAEARAKEAFDQCKDEFGVEEMRNLKTIKYAESEDEVGLQAADMYAYVWLRRLTGKLGGKLLPRAFKVLTMKKRNIFIADRTYFNNVGASVLDKRRADIERERAKGL